jgi:hypothetical protein
VKPHPITWNVRQRLVECRDVLLDDPYELGVRLVLVEQYPLHRQIRRVDLENESGVDNGIVFVSHLAGDRIQIGFVGWIVRIEHRGRDNSGRRLGEEALRERRLDRRRKVLETREFGLD